MNCKEELKILESIRSEKQKEIFELEEKIRTIRSILFTEETGIKIGSIVKNKKGIFKVCELPYSSFSMMKGYKQKVNNDFGKKFVWISTDSKLIDSEL